MPSTGANALEPNIRGKVATPAMLCMASRLRSQQLSARKTHVSAQITNAASARAAAVPGTPPGGL
ncbi:hypothetical protein GCM10010303_43600 [Streptomyces purpurascens]|nr:hypothetical protein GCM10010303_43600 [Streptomyces purpurascens]